MDEMKHMEPEQSLLNQAVERAGVIVERAGELAAEAVKEHATPRSIHKVGATVMFITGAHAAWRGDSLLTKFQGGLLTAAGAFWAQSVRSN